MMGIWAGKDQEERTDSLNAKGLARLDSVRDDGVGGRKVL